jgi:hypothetical protein
MNSDVHRHNLERFCGNLDEMPVVLEMINFFAQRTDEPAPLDSTYLHCANPDELRAGKPDLKIGCFAGSPNTVQSDRASFLARHGSVPPREQKKVAKNSNYAQ